MTRKCNQVHADTGLSVAHPHAAGIDVHAKTHYVAVAPDAVPEGFVPTADEASLPRGVRKFGAYTCDLEAIAAWLKDCGVTTVAMESTGVYWIALFDLLVRQGFTVILVDPRQTKHAPGRPKTDVQDCQWIWRLHRLGLLTASFRPADDILVWRGYQRQREMLIRGAAEHVLHMNKALEQMNVKLAEVVSDIAGLTGMSIIKDILAGNRDPLQLAKHRNERCKASEAEIARSLKGNWRDEHLFALEQAVLLYEEYHRLLRACDKRIEACLVALAQKYDKSGGELLEPKPRRRKKRASEPTFQSSGGVRQLLFAMSGVDLTQIEGIDETTALVVLSEIGTDLSRFPTVKRFVSWLGLCPQHRGSGGRIYRRSIGKGLRKGANRAARALRMAAQGCHRAKNALGAFYRRIQSRSGGPKALVATARKIAERVYRMLKHGQSYVRQEESAYEELYRQRVLKGMARRAQSLGYKLVPATTEKTVP
jgi:transposase